MKGPAGILLLILTCVIIILIGKIVNSDEMILLGGITAIMFALCYWVYDETDQKG